MPYFDACAGRRNWDDSTQHSIANVVATKMYELSIWRNEKVFSDNCKEATKWHAKDCNHDDFLWRIVILFILSFLSIDQLLDGKA